MSAEIKAHCGTPIKPLNMVGGSVKTIHSGGIGIALENGVDSIGRDTVRRLNSLLFLH